MSKWTHPQGLAALVAGIVFFICGVIGQGLVKPVHLHESAFKIEIAGAEVVFSHWSRGD
jgi:hypothetical protein